MAKQKPNREVVSTTGKHRYKQREVPIPPSRYDDEGKLMSTPYVPQSTLTKEDLKASLPKGTSIAVTDEIMRLIENMEEDTGLPQEELEHSVKGYLHTLTTSGNYGLKDYISAIKFCNLKPHIGQTDAWCKVFPERAHRLTSRGENKSTIANHASMYNSGKLVAAIDKQMMVPVYLQYAPYFDAAIKKQFELMNGKSSSEDVKVSAMVEHLAAKELAVLTAQPLEATINVKTSPSDAALSMQAEMAAQLKAIVAGQKRELEAGASIIDVQAIGLDFSEIGADSE